MVIMAHPMWGWGCRRRGSGERASGNVPQFEERLCRKSTAHQMPKIKVTNTQYKNVSLIEYLDTYASSKPRERESGRTVERWSQC